MSTEQTGTTTTDEQRTAREAVARWLWNRREDVIGDFDGDWAGENPLDRRRSLEDADELLAVAGLVHAEADVTHCRGCAADRKAAS